MEQTNSHAHKITAVTLCACGAFDSGERQQGHGRILISNGTLKVKVGSYAMGIV